MTTGPTGSPLRPPQDVASSEFQGLRIVPARHPGRTLSTVFAVVVIALVL